MQLHRLEPHLHPKALGLIRHRPFGQKQGKLLIAPAPLVEGFDQPAPPRVLAVVEAGRCTTTARAPAFDNAPVTALLAVLPSPRESQVHGPQSYAQSKIRTTRVSAASPFDTTRVLSTKFQNQGASWKKLG
jgi:hypothetical protein